MTKSAFPFALLVVVLATPAHADTFFTDTARFNAASTVPVDLAPLDGVSIGSLSDAGRLFQNTIDPGGATVLGNRTNAVGALIIDTAKVGGAASGVNKSGIVSPTGQQMVAIFGVQGVVETPAPAGGGFSKIRFTEGHLQIAQITPGTFNQNDVTSWGFNNGVLANYILKPQENIVPGPVDSEPRFLPANQTNVAAGNLAIFADLQTVILLEEDPAFGHNLLDSDSGLAAILAALGYTVTNEAIFGDLAEEVTGLTELILGPAEQAILNAIAQFGFGEDFANFGAGGPTDFTVDFANINTVADFVTDIGGNFIPGLQGIIEGPEPASVLAWVVVGLIGASFVNSRWASRHLRRAS